MKNTFLFTAGEKTMFFFMAILFACFSANLSAQLSEKDLTGTWIMESNGDQLAGGNINFTDKGKYQFKKDYTDGTSATLSGTYELDRNASPVKLKLCLGDCGTAGSEWTTSFCLIRISTDGKLEIICSQDSNFPSKFPKDKMAAGYYVFTKK